MAAESAAAEARAAAAALRAVEAGIALYAEKRDYLKLKDIAEASDVAGKVRSAHYSLFFIYRYVQIFNTPPIHEEDSPLAACFNSQDTFIEPLCALVFQQCR